jgi:hypothetical protein
LSGRTYVCARAPGGERIATTVCALSRNDPQGAGVLSPCVSI